MSDQKNAMNPQSKSLDKIEEILTRLLADVDDSLEFRGTVFKSDEMATNMVSESIKTAQAQLQSLISDEVIKEWLNARTALHNAHAGFGECLSERYIEARLKELQNE